MLSSKPVVQLLQMCMFKELCQHLKHASTWRGNKQVPYASDLGYRRSLEVQLEQSAGTPLPHLTPRPRPTLVVW